MKTTFANDLHDYMVRFSRQLDPAVPSLPLELVCNIMSYLDCLNLLQCQLVCKIFRKLILETSRLSYTIDLYKYRTVSAIPSPQSSLHKTTYNSRLALLRERERNWRMLAWKHRCTVELPPTGSLYEFVGGVYANGREGENRITASISFLELPSAGMVEKEKEAIMVHGLTQWTHLMPDYNIIDFTMDPVQDLLVLVVVAPPDSQHVYDLHIRSIKTNQPHPLAPKSIFPCLPKPNNQPHPFDVVTAVRVQVCGHLVALLIKEVFDNSGGYLEIWNWTHGPSQSCSMPRAHGIDDFTFLTKEVCLVVRPTGRFEVYDFVDPCKRSSEPVLRYAFAFPPLSKGYTYWYISLSSNPTPGWAPEEQNVPEGASHPTMEGFLKGHQQIHYPSPEERVHACCLYVFNPADPVLHAVSSFVFFIKIESLLRPAWPWFHAWRYEDDDDSEEEEEEILVDAGNTRPRPQQRRRRRTKEDKRPYYNPDAEARRLKEEQLANWGSDGPPQGPRFHEELIPDLAGYHDRHFQAMGPRQRAKAKARADSDREMDVETREIPVFSSSSPSGAGASSSIPAGGDNAFSPLSDTLFDHSHAQHHSYSDDDEEDDYAIVSSSTAANHPRSSCRSRQATRSPTPHPPPPSAELGSEGGFSFPPPMGYQEETSEDDDNDSHDGDHGHSPSSSPSPDPATCEPIPWTAWGPQNTRWFEECLSTDWQHAIYGMRAVESVEVSKLTAERQFRIHEWPGGAPPSSSAASGIQGPSTCAHGYALNTPGASTSTSGASGSGTNGAATALGVGVGEGDGGSTSSIGQGGFISFATQAGLNPSQAAWNPMSTTTTTIDGGVSQPQTQPSSSSHPPPPLQHHLHQQNHPPPPQPQPLPPQDDIPRREKRFLRVRDFSPYALTRAARLESQHHPILKAKNRCRAVWRTPKIVRDASRVYTKGVFKEDIMSSLPYVETVTDETFDVTDVMMDDGRLLLLKRGPAGRISQMEVLMM